MKNLRKVLALVTMLTMLLSVAVSAGTLYPDVADDASYAQAVETLNALEVMVGDEKGNFNPDASITRAEAAAVVVRLKNLGDAANAAGATVFTDVPADHWAAGYVNFAQQSGIINGYGDGTFGPSDPVTYEQIVKMIVAALGYTPEAEAKGGYPSGYMMVASQNDITKGVSVKVGTEAPRAAVARAAYNALEVPMMEQKGYGDNATFEAGTKTLLANFLKVEKIEGIVAKTVLTDGKPEDDAYIVIKTGEKKVEEKVEDILTEELLVGETDAISYLGYAVEAYVAEDEETGDKVIKGITKKAFNDELVLDETMIANVPAEKDEDGKKTLIIEYLEDADAIDELEADIYGAKRFFNGKADKGEVKAFIEAAKGGKVFGTLKLISNDRDDAYEYVMLTQATAVDVVTDVDAEYLIVETKNSNIDIDVENEKNFTYFFKADGSVAELADIKVDDVITEYKNGNLQMIYISDAKVEGALDETYTMKNGETVYVVGGKDYRIAYVGGSAAAKVDADAKSVVFFLDADGKVVYAEEEKGDANYAFLFLAMEISDVNTGSAVQLKALTSEGKWEVFTTSAAFMKNNASGVDGLFKYDGAVKEYTQTVFKYELDKNGYVSEIKVPTKNDFTAKYRASSDMIGGVKLADTVVFSVPTIEDGKKYEEDQIKIAKSSDLFSGIEEAVTVSAFDYDAVEKTAEVALAVGVEADILEGTKLLVVTKLAGTRDEDNISMTKVYGLQNGAEVEGAFYSDCAIKGRDGKDATLAVGDVVIFSLDADGAINNIRVLMTKKQAADLMGTGLNEVEDDDMFDGVFEAYGFVYEKEGKTIFLAKDMATETKEVGGEKITVQKNPLKDTDDYDLSIALDGEGFTVYEINLDRDIIATSSVGAIKAVPNKEGAVANWAYVRMVDGEIIDVVVFTDKIEAIES